MRPLRVLAVVLAAGAALGAAASCSPKKALNADLPPDTRLFVSGPVDTVNHRVHVYWFGTDPDGQVVAYAMRWVYPPPAAQDPKWDTVWCALPGRCTDSLFTVQTGDSGVVSPRFDIFAIDDKGLADATPAQETFLLSNTAPTVTITNPLQLTDSTYATMTLNWNVDDPDGGGPDLHYRIWLDGNEVAYDSTAQQTFTIPSARFLQNGTFTSGLRTAYVQAVDDGGRAGPPTSARWYVRAPGDGPRPHGRVLLIDDAYARTTNNTLFDSFYLTELSTFPGNVVPAGSFSVLKLELQPNAFRTARDFAQTLRLFDAVVWYRGYDTRVSPLLASYQDSLAAYVNAGGRVLLDGLYLVAGLNVPGALAPTFVPAHLGSDYMYNNYNSTIPDSTAGWGNVSGANFRTSTYAAFPDHADTLRSAGVAPAVSDQTPGGIRAFAVRDTHNVAMWAFAGQLKPANAFDVPVAVTVPGGSGGRIVVFGIPIRILQPRPAGRLFETVLADPTAGLLAP